MGNKGRPFYRIVVAKSTAGRDGAFVEVLGSLDPLTKPATVKLDGERALSWLLQGAQPTETVAHWLKKHGVLDRFLEQRPSQRRRFKYLDKRTAAISVESAVGPVAPAEAPANGLGEPPQAPGQEQQPEPQETSAEDAIDKT
jgi:small subunit ribosomal protein S16